MSVMVFAMTDESFNKVRLTNGMPSVESLMVPFISPVFLGDERAKQTIQIIKL